MNTNPEVVNAVRLCCCYLETENIKRGIYTISIMVFIDKVMPLSNLKFSLKNEVTTPEHWFPQFDALGFFFHISFPILNTNPVHTATPKSCVNSFQNRIFEKDNV